MFNVLTDLLDHLLNANSLNGLDPKKRKAASAEAIKELKAAHSDYRGAVLRNQTTAHELVIDDLQGHLTTAKTNLKSIQTDLETAIQAYETESVAIRKTHEAAVKNAKKAKLDIPELSSADQTKLDRLAGRVEAENKAFSRAKQTADKAAERMHNFLSGGREKVPGSTGRNAPTVALNQDQVQAYQRASAARQAVAGVTEDHPFAERMAKVTEKNSKVLGLDHSFDGAGTSAASTAKGASAGVKAGYKATGLSKALGLDFSSLTITNEQVQKDVAEFEKAAAKLGSSPVSREASALTAAQGKVASMLDKDGNKLASVKDDALATARKAVEEKAKAFEEALGKNKEHASVKAFTEARGKVKGLAGMFGEAKAKGFFGAVKNNFTPSAKGNGWGKVAMRGASTVAGGAMLLDAFRAKTSEGEDRSWVTRVGEGVVGAGLFAGGLALGKAR